MDAELAERLRAIFSEELEAHVRALSEGFLALEAGPSPEERAEIFKALFREAHSLKGAARVVNADVLAHACHGLEDVLAFLRDGKRELDPALFRTLSSAVDALDDAGQRFREGAGFSGSPIEALITDLEAIRGGGTPAAAAKIDPPPPPPPPTPAPAPVAARIPVERLDALLRGGGELLIARARIAAHQSEVDQRRELTQRWLLSWRRTEAKLKQLTGDETRIERRAIDETSENLPRIAHELDRFASALKRDERRLAAVASALEEEIRRLRMVPFSELDGFLERALRDAAREKGCAAELILDHRGIELDRAVLERLRDALAHLVRNAVSHGIELPNERARAGKPERGLVRVSATLQGTNVEIAVEDDGRGVDVEGVRRAARARGLEGDVATLIFRPEVSTSPTVSEVSGRGIGLDVVKNRVEAIHGAVAFSSSEGRGTRFTITVPLTLTRVRALLVRASSELYAFVTSNVIRVLRLTVEDLKISEGRETIVFDGKPMPIVSLGAALGSKIEAHDSGRLLIVVVAAGADRIGFAVEELLSEQELVVKSLGPRKLPSALIAGATILPDGGLALILNAARVIRAALSEKSSPRSRPQTAKKKRVLIVEDSTTTRALEASILSAAGYEVLTAIDGVDATRTLQDHDVDAIVADVEMPRMDGIRLTESIRRSRKLRALPIVLLTGLADERDRQRGLEAGANAYLVKESFDQGELLATLERLL